LAKVHRVPFYIAAPSSTFDVTLSSGAHIPIEERHDAEIKELFFKQPVAPKGIKVYNPAFDVTPYALISAIITEKGVIRRPYQANIKRVIGD
jgi:methylthioribose-1-phosphate isomerase